MDKSTIYMKNKPDTWKRVRSEKIADCRVFEVRKDFCVRENSEKEASFFTIESPNWVNILALTSSDEVVFIEQFRHGIEETILEIPGGMIDGDEKHESAARRELLEETGYSSENWVYLGKSFPNPAIQNNTIFHYLALNCEKTRETEFDEHESVVTTLLPLAGCGQLVADGKITHSLVVTALYYFELYRKNLQ